jgi:hypothetical protein
LQFESSPIENQGGEKNKKADLQDAGRVEDNENGLDVCTEAAERAKPRGLAACLHTAEAAAAEFRKDAIERRYGQELRTWRKKTVNTRPSEAGFSTPEFCHRPLPQMGLARSNLPHTNSKLIGLSL